MKALSQGAFSIGCALFLFIAGCGRTVAPPVPAPPLEVTTPGEKFLFPIIVNHTPLSGCHPAFRALGPLYKGLEMKASYFQHLNGSPQIPFTIIKCDTCRRSIEYPLPLHLTTSPCPTRKAE